MSTPKAVYAPTETDLEPNKPYILTPPESPSPRINCPAVFAVRPGNPFLFTVTATGSRPMTFQAKGLPQGLTLDPQTGLITGAVQSAGTYPVTLKASNSNGTVLRELKIMVGDNIALTPPMGWNSWNCWAGNVSEENVRASAKAMADSGLINHGWTYINIDDTWQGARGGPFNAIQSNQKFPDMKKLCDYIHSLGLKAGIYSTPWITSYAEYTGGSSDDPLGAWDKDKASQKRLGKYPFDSNDSWQWASWGIDYLKYDWYPNDINSTTRMANALRTCGRDIVYSLSNSAPFDKAPQLSPLANCWRTTGDIRDYWSPAQLPADQNWAMTVTAIMDHQSKWYPFSRPGHWNDPDMLVVGKVGWGNPHPTNLTPDEQYTHISLWCLWSAPLLLGCPLDQLDAFTLNLLTNDEVLALNQDPLGKQAQEIVKDGTARILAKELADGSKAVGLINTGSANTVIKITWPQLGINGKKQVRDLWRQKDIGIYDTGFEATVRPHGIILVRIF